MCERRTLVTILLTALLTSSLLLLLHYRGINLFPLGVQKQTGSFGLFIEGFRGVTHGGEQNNSIYGSEGGEDLLGGAGNDDISASGGDDFLYGEADDDILDGGTGRDIVMGGSGNDIVIGFDSFELIDGGEGNDTLKIPNSCKEFRLEDHGHDTKTFRSGCGVDLVTIKSVENLIVEAAPMQGPTPMPKSRGAFLLF
jgi:RTX calcium-binding nonapeptide repeat (4 copies)